LKIVGDSSVKVTGIFPPKKSEESIIDIIESIVSDIPRVFQVNIINEGSLVPGIPEDFSVEVPVLINGRGIQKINIQGLPKPVLSYILRDRVAPVEVELEAYENGSRERLLDLVMMDPWTRSEEQACNLLRDILALPGFEELRRHYR